MIFNAELRGKDELIRRLSEMPNKVRMSLVRAVHSLVLLVQGKVIRDHLSGPTGSHSLSRISGALSRALQTSVSDSATSVIGKVFFAGSVAYAAIHEYGGVIHVPEIVPSKAGALAFMMGGKEVIVARTAPHDVVMPERAPLRTGFGEMVPIIDKTLKEAVVEGML